VSLACGQVVGRDHGFAGDRDRYDHPGNSMLDLELSRRRGLPILLSVVYIEAIRRAGIPLVGYPRRPDAAHAADSGPGAHRHERGATGTTVATEVRLQGPPGS
jgi:hypothetical protein